MKLLALSKVRKNPEARLAFNCAVTLSVLGLMVILSAWIDGSTPRYNSLDTTTGTLRNVTEITRTPASALMRRRGAGDEFAGIQLVYMDSGRTYFHETHEGTGKELLRRLAAKIPGGEQVTVRHKDPIIRAWSPDQRVFEIAIGDRIVQSYADTASTRRAYSLIWVLGGLMFNVFGASC